MNQQCFAFDTLARISRKSDPITSQKSAAETEPKLGKYKAAILDVMAMTPHPMTAQEAARAAVFIYEGMTESYRKRMRELVEDGKVEESGERRCEVTGKSAMTFRVKEQR